MTSRLHTSLAALLALALPLASSCGSSSPEVVEPIGGGDGDQTDVVVEREPVREEPPPSGEIRDVRFPPIARATIASGLELNTVELHQLPVVYVRLVVNSGGETDPANLPGLAQLVAAMLEEGTRTRSSAELAETVEFLGADLSAASDEENVYVMMRALRDHLDEALEIVADVAMNPAFSNTELRKLKKRELDRLALMANDPGFLSSREFYKALYGDHPYARVDTTPEAVRRVSRTDLSRWHRTHFVPNNAFLVVTGDVTPDQVKTAAERAFGRWRPGTVPEPTYAEPPARDGRTVIVVDRPESVQSVISIGNLAVPRSSPDYVPLLVANQVLGGSAASRLFMDLRERRSLTYGAYSGVGERVQVAPFRARAAVRNEVTSEAMTAFFEHLQRITTEAPPEEELAAAKRYLVDSFPLQIDTPGKIADLVAELRIFGLPDEYWDQYRSSVRAIAPNEALTAARQHILPDRALVVVVGRAADVVPVLRQYGPVQVVDTQGRPVQEPAPAAAAAGAAATPPAAR